MIIQSSSFNHDGKMETTERKSDPLKMDCETEDLTPLSTLGFARRIQVIVKPVIRNDFDAIKMVASRDTRQRWFDMCVRHGEKGVRFSKDTRRMFTFFGLKFIADETIPADEIQMKLGQNIVGRIVNFKL